MAKKKTTKKKEKAKVVKRKSTKVKSDDVYELVTKFKPTEQMQRFLEARLDLSIAPTITAETEAAGVTRKTYYQWLKKPEFIRWFNEEYEKAIKIHGSWLDKVGFMQGAKDYNYWLTMQKKHGGLKMEDSINSALFLNIVSNGRKPEPDNS